MSASEIDTFILPILGIIEWRRRELKEFAKVTLLPDERFRPHFERSQTVSVIFFLCGALEVTL